MTRKNEESVSGTKVCRPIHVGTATSHLLRLRLDAHRSEFTGEKLSQSLLAWQDGIDAGHFFQNIENVSNINLYRTSHHFCRRQWLDQEAIEYNL